MIVDFPQRILDFMELIVPWCEADGTLKENALEEILKAKKEIHNFMKSMEGYM